MRVVLLPVIVALASWHFVYADDDIDRKKSFIFLRARSQGGAKKYFSPIKQAKTETKASDGNVQLLILTKKVLELEKRLEELTKSKEDVTKSGTCIQGPPGRDGLNGRDGLPGPPGRDGLPGRDGKDIIHYMNTPAGLPPGKSKYSRVRRGKFESGDMQETEEERNVTYVRWGRRDCRTGTDISVLLSGRVTIKYSTSPTYMCSPAEKAVDSSKSMSSFHVAGIQQVYGVEYKLDDVNPFPAGLNAEDVACTVCNVQNQDVVSLFPGMKTCPTGWNLEYKGYLMSENWNHIRTENLCVDENAQKSSNKPYDEHTAQISLVKSYCNGQPCGTDQDESIMRCVVCSQVTQQEN